MWFTSDNAGPAAPEIVEAVVRANAGHAASYGEDEATARVTALVRETFEAPEAAVRLVPTGTAANALALACLSPPWGAILCHDGAHVEVDECGAAHFYTGGAKLVPVAGPHGAMDPAALDARLHALDLAGLHGVQKAAISVTNLTEAGTAVTPHEVAALAAVARRHGVPVHMDGARLGNALASLGCSPADLTWKAGVDALSLGGTKNGCLGVEAVVLFDPARDRELQLRRKRGGHLFSKHRFLAAQMEAYLSGGLWLDLARRANALAARLAEGLRTRQVELLHPVEGNMMFPRMTRATHRRMRDAGARYHIWDGGEDLAGPAGEKLVCRLVCSFATTEDEIGGFLAALG